MRSGFTLLEIFLAVALLALLVGALVASFAGALQAGQVRENTTRISSLLRAARAEAALTGRRLRLRFDGETTQPIVEIEPDPLGEPNVFRPFQSWWVRQAQLTGGVRVLSCSLTGISAAAGVPRPAGEEGQSELATILFTPDGGSDSARIVVGTGEDEDAWAAEIVLNGADGSVQARELDLTEESVEPE